VLVNSKTIFTKRQGESGINLQSFSRKAPEELGVHIKKSKRINTSTFSDVFRNGLKQGGVFLLIFQLTGFSY
jgi:hypothetical protein